MDLHVIRAKKRSDSGPVLEQTEALPNKKLQKGDQKDPSYHRPTATAAIRLWHY
jgi:hypothetical protein